MDMAIKIEFVGTMTDAEGKFPFKGTLECHPSGYQKSFVITTLEGRQEEKKYLVPEPQLPPSIIHRMKEITQGGALTVDIDCSDFPVNVASVLYMCALRAFQTQPIRKYNTKGTL